MVAALNYLLSRDFVCVLGAKILDLDCQMTSDACESGI